jgi:hypothetical protein
MSARFLPRLGIPLAGVALALTTGIASAGASSEPGSTSSATGWRIENTIGAPFGPVVAGHFAATGASDAFSSWSCGSCAPGFPHNRNPVQHWNGKSWRVLKPPSALNYPRSIISISASSASNMWAFTSARRAAIWNGSHWTVRTVPSWALRPTQSGDPQAASAVFSRSNAWLFSVGAISQPTLAAHYRAGRWHKVTLPGAPVSVSAVGRNDIWALGITKKSLTAKTPVWAAMHWNGSSWRTLLPPRASVPSGDVASYTAIGTGPRNVWLARTIGAAGHTSSVSLLHWNGHWKTIKVPHQASSVGPLASDGHGGLWMIAQRGFAPANHSFLYHYNNGHWTFVATPTRRNARATLATITRIPGTRSLWAAGDLLRNGGTPTGDTLKYTP